MVIFSFPPSLIQATVRRQTSLLCNYPSCQLEMMRVDLSAFSDYELYGVRSDPRVACVEMTDAQRAQVPPSLGEKSQEQSFYVKSKSCFGILRKTRVNLWGGESGLLAS